MGEERALGEDVDAAHAHRADHVRVLDRRLDANAEPLEALRVDLQRRAEVHGLGPIRRLVPPHAEKTDLADLAADLLECGQELLGDLLPPPPVVADMQDVVALRRRRAGSITRSGLNPKKGSVMTLGSSDGRRVGLMIRSGEGIVKLEPLAPLGLGLIVAVVAVDDRQRIVLAVGVDDDPIARGEPCRGWSAPAAGRRDAASIRTGR